MLSNIWVKLGLVAAVLVLIAGLGMLLRLEKAKNETLKVANVSLTSALKVSNDTTAAYVKNYDDLQKSTNQRLDAIQEALKGHTVAIQGIEAEQSKSFATLKHLRETNNETDTAILNHHLPQYRCLFDGTCADKGR